MPKPRTEEQFPLLLVLVGEQDITQNNKRLFGRGRFDGITSGASAIITEWPNYLSSCWLTAFICGITLFIVSIMLTSCMTFQNHVRLPRCSSDYQIIDNRTIHLVHTSHKWYPKQLEIVENITNSFPNYQIHILIINNKSWRYNKLKRQINHLIKQNDTQHVVKNESEKTIDDLAKQYPNILLTNMSYAHIFQNSPLFLNWVSLSQQMKIFAVRVLQLWQFGGLSYDLLEYKSPVPKRYKNCTNFAEKKLKIYIRDGPERYEKIDPEVVSVDHHGFHMESKTPCHAFFGKVLMKLRKANGRSTARGILSGPMYTFCRDGAIDPEFCHFKNILF